MDDILILIEKFKFYFNQYAYCDDSFVKEHLQAIMDYFLKKINDYKWVHVDSYDSLEEDEDSD